MVELSFRLAKRNIAENSLSLGHGTDSSNRYMYTYNQSTEVLRDAAAASSKVFKMANEY